MDLICFFGVEVEHIHIATYNEMINYFDTLKRIDTKMPNIVKYFFYKRKL